MLNFLIARLSSSLPCGRKTQLGFLHHNSSHIFNSFSSVVKLSEANQLAQKQKVNESFTVSYLMNSCGLSAKVAIQVSKRVHLKVPDNPDSVLSLFRRYGFSETQISKLVERHAQVLSTNPEKTLLPKLRFFQSIGFSGSELPELLICNPRLLASSLKKSILPRYDVIKSLLGDDRKVCKALKRAGWGFIYQDVTNVVPNVKVLREHGVPQSSVSLLVTNFPHVAFTKPAEFVEHVKFAKKMGIEPSKPTFIQAIHMLAVTKKSSWASKLDMFERCGWCRDVTLSVFRKYPYCMALSEEKITNSMKFLVDEMGLSLEDIARCPAFLGYNLKHRIIPRCSVVKLLKMKGLINNDLSLHYFIKISEKDFLDKFVIRFQESVPQLLKIYGGEFRPLPEVQI